MRVYIFKIPSPQIAFVLTPTLNALWLPVEFECRSCSFSFCPLPVSFLPWLWPLPIQLHGSFQAGIGTWLHLALFSPCHLLMSLRSHFFSLYSCVASILPFKNFLVHWKFSFSFSSNIWYVCFFFFWILTLSTWYHLWNMVLWEE